jgi:hypothetical protein
MAEMIRLFPAIAIRGPRWRPSANFSPLDTLLSAEKLFPPSFEPLKYTVLPWP